MPYTKIYYQIETQGSITRMKVGNFYEVLNETQRQLIIDMITSLYRTSKEHSIEEIVLTVCFESLTRYQSELQHFLFQNNFEYQEYKFVQEISNTIMRKLSQLLKTEAMVFQALCKNDKQLSPLLGYLWPHKRLAFRICKPSTIDISDSIIDWDFFGFAESIPNRLLEGSICIICPFFHGFWIEIGTKELTELDLEDGLSSAAKLNPNIELARKKSWDI